MSGQSPSPRPLAMSEEMIPTASEVVEVKTPFPTVNHFTKADGVTSRTKLIDLFNI